MNHARRFVTELHAYNQCFPNIQLLAVRPGTVLSASGTVLKVEGRLDQFIKGDDGLRDRVQAAIERLEPKAGNATGTRQTLNLVSSGTTVVSSDAGIKVKLPQAEVEVKILITFKKASDFLFDTTDPAWWFTFSDTEMKDINRAALAHLASGMYVVTGAAWSARWMYRISQTDGGSIGINTAADVAGVDVSRLADLRVSAGFSVGFDAAGSLKADEENSVACFCCIKRTSSLFQGDKVGPLETLTLNPDDELVPTPTITRRETVGAATPADLFGEE